MVKVAQVGAQLVVKRKYQVVTYGAVILLSVLMVGLSALLALGASGGGATLLWVLAGIGVVLAGLGIWGAVTYWNKADTYVLDRTADRLSYNGVPVSPLTAIRSVLIKKSTVLIGFAGGVPIFGPQYDVLLRLADRDLKMDSNGRQADSSQVATALADYASVPVESS